MEDEEEREADHTNALATLYRIDPQKLAAIKRIATGSTRCPSCDAVNPADNRFCEKCGGKLYPVEEEDDKSLIEKLEHKDDEEEIGKRETDY